MDRTGAVLHAPGPCRALRAGAVAGLVLLGAAASPALEPPNFSGYNCSLTSCDCSCIAGQQQMGTDAVAKLGVTLHGSLTRTLDRIPPLAAMSRARELQKDLQQLITLIDYKSAGLLAVADLAVFETQFAQYIREKSLPDPPAGWRWDERYLRTLEGVCRAEMQRIEPLAESQKTLDKELQDCRAWARQKQCDPNLTGPPEAAPPRVQPPAPPPVTPPRELPPDGPQPIRRHADGRPYVDDALITRYVAASQAKVREGGAYWRHGQMGQADYAEISGRFQEYFRYENGPEIGQRFDDAEIGVIARRRAEVNKAYYEDW